MLSVEQTDDKNEEDDDDLYDFSSFDMQVLILFV